MNQKTMTPVTPQMLLDPKDEDWKKKQRAALKARELGAKLRQGKPKSFRLAVGRAR